MKTVLRRVGFFKEMGGDEYPRVAEAQWGAPPLPEMVEYLTQGQCLIYSPGPVRDVYDASCGFVGTGSILTDGVWAWRDDTRHYVSAHGLVLPMDFIEHAQAQRFRVPELSVGQLRGLSL